MGLAESAKSILQKFFRMKPRTMVWFSLFFYYHFGGWFALKILDSFFEFDNTQKKNIKKELDNIHFLIRKNILPSVEDYVNQLGLTYSHPISEQDYDNLYEENVRLRELAFREMLQPILSIIGLIRPGQVPSEMRFYKLNKRLIQKYRLSPEARFERRFEKVLLMFEDFFGPLSESQKNALRSSVSMIPDLTALRLDYHVSMQERFVELINSPNREEIMEDRLRQWLFDLRSTRSDEFLAAIQVKRDATRAMLIQFLSSLTESQRKYFVKEVNTIARQIHSYVQQ